MVGAFEFFLPFTFLAAGILASVGYAVITVTPADFKLARTLFLIAGALVFADDIMWGVLTNSPLWTRILIVGLIGAVSAVATNEAIRWLNNREKIAEPPSTTLPKPEIPATPLQQAQQATLPPNAKFIYKEKIFWAISRPYTKEENSDIRTALREVYDCISTYSTPIISNYDGPAPMFTREWISIIEKQGAESAVYKLTEIRTKIRVAATKLQDIVKRRPYFSDEIRGIIDDKGEIGIMIGSLNDYIEALKSIPRGASQQLIKLAVGNSEAKFEDAIKNYSGWVGRFNNKMMVAKDDLDRLMTIE